MAKKHQYRASAAEKRKRKEALQKQKTQEFFRKNKQFLIITAAVLVVLIVAAVLLSNKLYYTGALQVKDNAIVGMQDNWLVKNMGSMNKPKYVKIAEVDIPENYENKGPLTSDKLENNYLVAALDENALINQYTVLVMKDDDAKTTAASGLLNSAFIREGEMQEVMLNGRTVYVTTGLCEDQMADAEGNFTDFLGYYKLISASMDTPKGGCVKVTGFTPNYQTLDEMPTDEDVLAALENIFANIRLEEK